MDIPYYQPCTRGLLRDIAGPDMVLEVSQRYPGLFIPFGFIDYTAGPDHVERMKERGFVGLKAIRPPLPYDDPSYLPIYEKADALRMPILFHVGIIAKNLREEMTPAQSLGPTNMRPSMLDGIAAAFPKLPLIAGHMGFPWLDELLEMLYYYPNTYCSLCGLVDYKWLIDNLDKRCSRDQTGRQTMVDRMLFASDSMYGVEETFGNVVKLARFMEGFFAFVGSRFNSWGDKADEVFHKTAASIMAMTCEQSKRDHLGREPK